MQIKVPPPPARPPMPECHAVRNPKFSAVEGNAIAAKLGLLTDLVPLAKFTKPPGTIAVAHCVSRAEAACRAGPTSPGDDVNSRLRRRVRFAI
jgi:hypothetical protein